MSFTIVDDAVATQSSRTSKYAAALNSITTAIKNEDGTFSGKALEVEKPGEVLSLRAAAKVAGVGIVTRKQADGKTRVWKVAKTDLTPRKKHEKKAKVAKK